MNSVCVDGMVALLRELQPPAGTVAQLEVGLGSTRQHAEPRPGGRSLHEAFLRVGVPRLRCAFGGRLYMEVGVIVRASGISARQER